MKNTHILPTEKPSRLHTDLRDLFLTPKYQIGKKINSIVESRNIYITSNEEIEEGDYYITILDNEIFKADSSTVIIMNDANQSPDTTYKNTHFKIILTSDLDLIKDGVQAIKDEFLEWFVNNPSCEEVEVEIESKFDRVDGHYHDVWEIIIPKEEPKQETLEEVLGSSKCQFSVIENKLATLYRNQVKIYNTITKQEQMYSEEELLAFGKSCFYKGFEKAEKDDTNCYTAFREEIVSLVEQFKNK